MSIPMHSYGEGDSENEQFLRSSPGAKTTPENLDADYRPYSLPSKESDRLETKTTRLERSIYVIFLALGYTILALFAWVLTCILTYRPIGVPQYGYQWNASFVPASKYLETTSWYRAARIVQSIVAVLTVPLASALCSRGVVIYTQNHGQRQNMSMRQTIVLADKGWTDPATWFDLLRGRSRRYGSLFLFWAIAVVLLGAINSPLQELFLTQTTRKMPSNLQYLFRLSEIPDLFPNENTSSDDNTLTVLTRSAMTATALTDVQSRLWQRNPQPCINSSFSADPDSDLSSELCTAGGSSLSAMTKLREPFLAPFASNFSTGLVRQFSPRMNSSSHVSYILPSDWPTDCSSRKDSFFAQYANVSGYRYWDVTLCMPANYSETPIRNTRQRQDFSESLYVNISLTGFFESTDNISVLYKVDLNTTIGYFELPNYMNNQAPGPLLSVDPKALCGKDCDEQGYGNNSISPYRKRAAKNTSISVDTSLVLERLVNKPPLLSITLGLFGEGSYFAERMAHPSSFFYTKNESLIFVPNDEATTRPGACIGAFPWLPLTNQPDGESSIQDIKQCLTNSIYDEDDLTFQIGNYLRSFIPNDTEAIPVERLENAFNAAAFLANEAWLVNNPNSLKNFHITFDLGQDVQAPQISVAGIIVVSIVLGVFLCNLLAVAIYSCWYPRWTATLNAFALMQIGAALHERLPLKYTSDVNKIKVLDEIPGYIGDIAPEGADVGQLGIGGETLLRRKRRYWLNVG